MESEEQNEIVKRREKEEGCKLPETEGEAAAQFGRSTVRTRTLVGSFRITRSSDAS